MKNLFLVFLMVTAFCHEVEAQKCSALLNRITAKQKGELKIPLVNTVTAGGDYYLEEIPESQRNGVLLKKVASVIKFANSQFEDRRDNWPPEFIAERVKVAKKYSKRSKYVVIRAGNVDRRSEKDPVAGTVGITYATYDKTTVDTTATSDRIPVEETLNLNALPRPLDSTGHGIILELRTYAKDKTSEQNAFRELLQGVYKLVFGMVKDFPELYKKPILYLYADALSVRFYKGFGFHVNEDIPPVEHDGVSWRVMSASPQDIELVSARLKGYRFIEDLNQPYVAIAPSGQPFFISPNSSFAIGADNVIHRATTMDELEIVPGVFAAANSEFLWGSSPLRARLKLSRPARMDSLDIIIPAGSEVNARPDGRITDAFFLTAPIYVEALGIRVEKRESIHTTYVKRPYGTVEQVSIGITKRQRLDNGVWAEKDTEAKWEKSPTTNKFTLISLD